MEADLFLKTLKRCVDEYRKLQMDTSDDRDLLHFFNPSLKKFLKDNKPSMDLLFAMKFNLPFSKFVETYIWKEQ